MKAPAALAASTGAGVLAGPSQNSTTTGGRVAPDLLDLLRQHEADIVAGYVKLKPLNNGRLVGCCPFHSDRKPSLTVYPDGRRLHCFGCGWNGDVFAFLQQHDGMTFRQAVEHVAQVVGIALPVLPRQTPAQNTEWRRRRSVAERQAAELIEWRDALILGLRGYRNNAWDRARAMETEATTLGPGSERAWTLTAESTEARRAGDCLDGYADYVRGIKAAGELVDLRRRLQGGAAC